MNLLTNLQHWSKTTPNTPALIDPKNTLTYTQLDQATSHGAQILTNSGIKKGDHILFLHPVDIHLYTALLATFHIGAIAVFIDPSAGTEHIKKCLTRIPIQAYFASPKAHLLRLIIPQLRNLKNSFHTSTLLPLTKKWNPSKTHKTTPPTDLAPEHPALITFTSGSTGTPKAAVRTHTFLLAQHKALAKSIHHQPAARDLITLPVFTLANLASGMTSIIANTKLTKPGFANGQKIQTQAHHHHPTRCAASPAFFQSLLDQNTLPDFQEIYTGGAPVFPKLLNQLQLKLPQANIYTVYGSTEAEPISHQLWSAVTPTDQQKMLNGQGMLVGHPCPEIQLRIIPDQHGTEIKTNNPEPLPPNQPGEIIVTGEHVLTGYLEGIGNAENKIETPTQTWHRTGDAGLLDEQGRLWLLGRCAAKLSDNTYPFQTECAAMNHHDLKACALTEHNNQKILAIQTSKPLNLTELQNQLHWANINKILPLKKVPLDPRHNAKINYPALKNLLNKIPKSK